MTRDVLADRGQDLTLDEVARRLGITRQAVLYHFPTKDRLLVELALVGLAEESDAMVGAIRRARSPADALKRFLRASLAFHLSDLDRFRLIYIRAQVVPGSKDTLSPRERRERVHPLTGRMYDALEAKLEGLPRGLEARELAVAIHLAALGFVTMAGELEGADDSMKLPMTRYADALAAALASGIGPERGRSERR